MCGIVGIISQNKKSSIEQQVINASQCIAHRGPNGEGVWINEFSTVVLAHKRLSIIDLSEAAAQPFHYRDRYVIIHNGEIYNYIEIREALQKKGYSFSSASDTEVIAAAYDAYGNKCLQHFDGMFAFAIWDKQRKILFAARDRMGEKPFFYAFDKNELVFASEIKALWSLGVEKKVNRKMLYNFFSLGYTSNPFDPSETFYEKVNRLPAASFFEYSFEENALTIRKYWDVEVIEENINSSDAKEKFLTLLNSSIQKRLRSDVPVGTSLSGGLDSSTIAALSKGLGSANFSYQTFTAAFEGFEKNEMQYATQVAQKFGLQQTIVTIEESELAELMNKVMHSQEEPISSSSPLAQYKVSEAAKEKGVKVLLDGQGADEILAGYKKYFRIFWRELYAKKELQKSGELQAAKGIGIEETFGLQDKIAAVFPHFSMALWENIQRRKAARNTDLSEDFLVQNKHDFYYALPSEPTLNSALYYNSFVNGLEELLRMADRNSMAHGVEVRLPFLQHELVKFLFSLPAGLKIKDGWSKWLLRYSMDDLLPKEITWRKDKIGFETPQEKWMCNKQVQEAILEGKTALVKNEILSTAALKKIKPHNNYAADAWDWKYWSASFLF